MESLTNTSKEEIENIFKSQGFFDSQNFIHNFRYSIILKPRLTIFLGGKISIKVPIEYHYPVELVSFYISIGIQPRWVDNNFSKFLQDFLINFQEIINELNTSKSYKFEFNFNGKEEKIKEILNEYFPDATTLSPTELASEKCINLKIRKKIFQHELAFPKFSHQISEDVLNFYKDFELQPTNELPAELSKGVPFERRNWIALFNGSDPNEYIIEEPGTITYFRDHVDKNIWFRSGFQSLTPNVWYETFQSQHYTMDYLFYDWIIYAKAILKIFLESINNISNFDTKLLNSFNEQKFLKNYADNQEISALFLPYLAYENQIASTPDKKLFETPPESLDESLINEKYQNALDLLNKTDLFEAKKKLKEVFQDLVKYHHLKGQLIVSLQISEVSFQQKQYLEARNVLQQAFEIIKSNITEEELIVETHFGLIKAYRFTSELDNANKHERILIKFIHSLPSENSFEELILKAYLKLSQLALSLNLLPKANEYSREVLKRMEKYPYYEFYYYYERSKYHAASDNPYKQSQALLKAIAVKEAPKIPKMHAKYDLANYYIEKKEDFQKAIKILEKLIDELKENKIEIMKFKANCISKLMIAYSSLDKDDIVIELHEKLTNLKNKIELTF